MACRRGSHDQGDDFRALPKRPLGPNHWVFINGEAVAQLPGGQGPACDVDELLGRIADDVAAVQGEGLGGG
jgi:hypothetical protein